MSISPPSDIILDVTRAADATRYSEAASRLHRLGPGAPAGADFADMLTVWGPESVDADPGATQAAIAEAAERAFAAAPPESALHKPDPFGAFEAMVLTRFVDVMMPKDNAAVFGSGTGGQIWASMMAEQIAAKVADAGGIGIADQLRAANPVEANGGGAIDPAVPATGGTRAGTHGAFAERGFLATLSDDAGGSPLTMMEPDA